MGLESEMCNGGIEDHLSQSKNGLEATKRVCHNKIEKKRKDRLKSAIHDIRKIIPLSLLSNKKATHCDVLEKVGEYIKSLEEENRRLLTSSNEDVRAEIISKLRKEREDLAQEKQHLMEIIEFSGMHSSVHNQTELLTTADDWMRRRSSSHPIVTVNNSENSPILTNCKLQAPLPKNSEAKVVEKTHTGKDENLSTLNPSLMNGDHASANQKSESQTMSSETLSLSSNDKSGAGCSGSAADPHQCSDLVLTNEDHGGSAVLPVGRTSQPSKPKKPKRTINLYLAEKKKNLQTPVVAAVIPSNSSLLITNKFLHNSLVKSWIPCQEIADSSVCITGTANHSTPALAAVLGSTQPEDSSFIETELTICTAMDSVFSVISGEKTPKEVLPCNDKSAINQNSVAVKCNSDVEESVNIIECCKESGVQLFAKQVFRSDILAEEEEQLENKSVAGTDTQTQVTINYSGNETEAALCASTESRIDVVTAAKSNCVNSNPSLVMCCHCKKFDVVLSKYDNKQRNGLRKCKSSDDLGKDYLERDNIVNPYINKMQRDLANENTPTRILLDRKISNLDRRRDKETSSELLENCQSNEKDSYSESAKEAAVENMNLASCEAASELDNGSLLAYRNPLRDVRESERLSEFRNNCQLSEHVHKDELAHGLIKEDISVAGKEQTVHVLGSKRIGGLDGDERAMLQVQLVNSLLSCSSDVVAVGRITSASRLGMLAVMQSAVEKDSSDDYPCSVIESAGRPEYPASKVIASLTPQSSCMRYSDERVMGLISSSSSSSLWNGTSNESQSKLSVCHNGLMFVMSDAGQNWLPITTNSLTGIPNNMMLPLPITFQSQSLQNASSSSSSSSSSIQLMGSVNPVVLPTINQPLTIFLPSNHVIPLISQPQVISPPSLIIPYHQLYGATVQVASMYSSVPQLTLPVLSADVTRNLPETCLVNANQHSNCVNSCLTSEVNKNTAESVLCVHSSSSKPLPMSPSVLPTSLTGDAMISVVHTSSYSMDEEESVMSVSQGISQQVISLHSSEILLDSGEKNLKRKLSMSSCTEPEVINVCRKARLSCSSEGFEKHLEAQIESSQLQNPNKSELSAQNDSLSEELCSVAIIAPSSSSSPSDICLNSCSVSDSNEDVEHDKNLLVSDVQRSSDLIGKMDRCVAGQSVDREAPECDHPLPMLQNRPLETSGNKEPIEPFPFVESALMKPSLWLLDFESKAKLAPAKKLTADDNNISSEFSVSRSSGWLALTPEHQDSQIVHNETAHPAHGQSFSATVIIQELPSYSASSKRELEQTVTHTIQCADVQHENEICGLFEPTASEHVEKEACRSNSASDESTANHQAMMNHERIKGESVVGHVESSHKIDELNQSTVTLFSHEHSWLSDVAYHRNPMQRPPYELDTINLDKHIWAPAVDVDKMDQLNLSVSTTSQIPGQSGMKRPSKASKGQKRKLISKVWADSVVSSRSVENVSSFNRGNSAVLSFNAPISSQNKEFSFQNFLPPPLPPLSQKSIGEGLSEAADKRSNYREVYQSLKSRQPESDSILVVPPIEVNEIISHSEGTIEKQNVESFNEDSSNVLSDALNFADNDDFPQIYLDEMDTIMDTHSAHGKPANQTKNSVAAWHQDLFDSSKRPKLRDKTDLDSNRHMDLDDRFPIHHRQDLFSFPADVFTENDDSSGAAVGSFSNVLLNRKLNNVASSSSSWQLPVFSESLNTPEKFSYSLTANEQTFAGHTSKPYGGNNNLYAAAAIDSASSFHLESASPVACTSSARPKTISSGGIFCLAQHAVQEKSDTVNNQLNSQNNYDFSYSLKEFPGTCRVESSKRNLEQTFGLRNRNFPDYNLPFYSNEISMDKPYGNIVNNVRCPPQSALWPSYSNKDQTKPTYASTSSAVISSATHLSFRPQVEVEYSNESHRTKVSAVQITSSLLSHSHGSKEKDCRPFAALSASVQSMDGLANAGSSWNDRVRDQGFNLPDSSPWKNSYGPPPPPSSLRSAGAADTGHENSPRNAFITGTTLSGSAEPNGRGACDQFHFSIALPPPPPPNTMHASTLHASSSSTLPPFSLACLPLEHSSSFSFNLTAAPDMNSVDASSNNQCSQEKRNQFSFYPLEHIDDDLPHAVPTGRITSTPPCSQVTVSNFTFNGCELSPRSNSIQRNQTESLQHHYHRGGRSRLSPDNQMKPLPSFFNIASYGMKDKILAPMCSQAFPHSKDLGSSSTLIHSGSVAVTHAMSFSPTPVSNSCSVHAYHPQNFYHHGATFPGSLTSPPLHHHPPLAAADHRHLRTSEPQSKFDSSFSLHGLQFPPVLNFVPPPHPHPPTFDNSMVRFSSQIIGDHPATVCVVESSIGRASHLSETISSKVPSSLVPQDQHAKQPTPSEIRSSKSGSKRSSRSSKKLSSRQTTTMIHNDRNNVTESSETVNPYFSLSNFSSGKNHSGVPTYFSSHPFRSEQGSCTTSSFNPLLTGPQASLNLRQPPSGFTNMSTSTQMPHTTSVPVLPPIHNFGFGNLFSDLNNPTALGGDGGMNMSPVKFHQGVPPPLPPPPPGVLPKQTNFDPSTLHHQPISNMPPIFLNRTVASSPPNILHSMSINSLLGNQRPRFEDGRSIASTAAVTLASGGIGGGMTTPFGLYRRP